MVTPRWHGAMLSCPECGKRQHPVVAAFGAAGPSLLRCTSCGAKGTPSEFGLMSEAERRERRRAQWRAYYHRHRDACRKRNRECTRRYRERHREEIARRNRDYRERNRDEVNDRARARYAENREEALARHKAWRDAKREMMGEAAYLRERRMKQRKGRR